MVERGRVEKKSKEAFVRFCRRFVRSLFFLSCLSRFVLFLRQTERRSKQSARSSIDRVKNERSHATTLSYRESEIRTGDLVSDSQGQSRPFCALSKSQEFFGRRSREDVPLSPLLEDNWERKVREKLLGIVRRRKKIEGRTAPLIANRLRWSELEEGKCSRLVHAMPLFRPTCEHATVGRSPSDFEKARSARPERSREHSPSCSRTVMRASCRSYPKKGQSTRGGYRRSTALFVSVPDDQSDSGGSRVFDTAKQPSKDLTRVTATRFPFRGTANLGSHGTRQSWCPTRAQSREFVESRVCGSRSRRVERRDSYLAPSVTTHERQCLQQQL